MKYKFYVHYDLVKEYEIESDDINEAIDTAINKRISLCEKCSKEVKVYEPVSWVCCNETGKRIDGDKL